jgi:hypothetical protein
MPLKLSFPDYRDVTPASEVCHLIVSHFGLGRFPSESQQLRVAEIGFAAAVSERAALHPVFQQLPATNKIMTIR